MTSQARAVPTISALRCPLQRGFERHDYGQLLLPFEASMTIVVETCAYTIAPGEALWVPAWARHRATRVAGRMLVVNINFGELGPGHGVAGDVRHVRLDGQAQAFCDFLRAGLINDGLSSAAAQRHSLGLLAALAPEVFAATGDSLAQAYARLTVPSERISIADLAARAHLSPSQFRRRFFERFGAPPRTIRSHARRNWAMQALQSPDIGVAEIAARLGYDNTASFTNFFRREVGMPPAAWRARYENHARGLPDDSR
ncbi:AraC family transcriptional regulator [Salinisphaera sp. T5B8]|uniref:helix-turn-helix domain-containing protein n=1 Tax=Salinisphaera sp. T5B8 TaxID=1304154 RepID=UPI00333ED379